MGYSSTGLLQLFIFELDVLYFTGLEINVSKFLLLAHLKWKEPESI